MTVFWSVAAIMVILAFLFLVPPLLRGGKRENVDQEELNAAVYRSQLAELKSDLENGKLSETEYTAARRDLEKELLYDLSPSAAEGEGARPARSGRWAVIVLVAVVPLLSYTLYQQLGASKLIPILQASISDRPNPQGTPHPGGDTSRLGTVEEMVSRLAERMKGQPDDLRGWVMLGRSYVSLQRYDAAINAYENVYRLTGGDDPQLLADQAEAIALANDDRLAGRPAELLDRALHLQPENPKALWLTGFLHYQKQDYAEAVRYWRLLNQLLPADSEQAASVEENIRSAEAKMGLAPLSVAGKTPEATPERPSAGSPAPATAGGKAVSVKVTLDPSLQDRVSPDDTVFIFARAVQGPKMPLAIVRKQVRDLPVTVTLDDSMAMTPAMVLSNFSEVTLGARVSRSGTAMPQSGDLQGLVSPVSPGSADVIPLTIAEVIP
jgi:cytochrome c-type biogenesis protein CcmH